MVAAEETERKLRKIRKKISIKLLNKLLSKTLAQNEKIEVENGRNAEQNIAGNAEHAEKFQGERGVSARVSDLERDGEPQGRESCREERLEIFRLAFPLSRGKWLQISSQKSILKNEERVCPQVGTWSVSQRCGFHSDVVSEI